MKAAGSTELRRGTFRLHNGDMKTEKYLLKIEMPDGDNASPTWVRDALQAEADVEDEGRWKVFVRDYN